MLFRLPLILLCLAMLASTMAAAATAQLNQLEQRLSKEPAQVNQELTSLLTRLELRPERHRALLLKARSERELKRNDAALATLEQLLADEPQAHDQAHALLLKAKLTGTQLHQRGAALALLDEALAVAHKAPAVDPALERELLETKGKALLHLGQTQNALHHFVEAQKRLRAGQQPELHAWNLIYQAQAQSTLARYDQAEDLYLQALAKVERNQFPNLDAEIYARLATLVKEQGSYDKALQYADKALELYTSLNDTFNIMRTFNRIGAIHADQGDYENALVHYLNALDISPDGTFDPAMRSVLLYNIGEAYVQLGQHRQAKPYLQQALTAFEQSEQPAFFPPVLLQLATVAEAEERTAEAVTLTLRARDVAEQASPLEQRLEVYDALAARLAANNRFEEAWQAQLKARQLAAERQFKTTPAVTDNSGMLEREQLLKQLDTHRAALSQQRQQQQYHELTLQLLALFCLCVLWLLYYRWRRDWRLRRILINHRRAAERHPATGLANLQAAESYLTAQLAQLQQRYERWYGEERGLIPRDTLRCALITLPSLELWNHGDGLLAGTRRHREFCQTLAQQAGGTGWRLFSLRDGLLLACAKRQRSNQQQLDSDASQLVELSRAIDGSQLCALALSDFPFTPRVSRAVDGERLLQVLQAGLSGARQLMLSHDQPAWLTLQPLDTLPATLLAADTADGTLLAIRNGMIRISASHERHLIRWPSSFETMAPVMGESVASRYTESSLGPY